MFFDREAKEEAGMPPLVPAFPILMRDALCSLSPSPKGKQLLHLVLVHYYLDQNLLHFFLFCEIILLLSVMLSVPALQDCFVFTTHLHCLFLQFSLAHIFLKSFCPLLTLCLWLLIVLRYYEYYTILLYHHLLRHYYVLTSGFTAVK